ncbi:hypothetical protein ABZW18_23275 [Streptomyces sp. NPDC004647]|uniref:hypothetical protein n=1 Tax=Streptomyces sp. NPDC004647 TaxID=3154671 RepID=UPI0033B216F3
MIRILWTEMRRGEAKWVAGLLALIGGTYFLSADPAESDWIGWWTQASIEVEIFAVMVMGPLMSTVAAWGAGRSQRYRTRAWTDTAARSVWTQTVVLWLATWLWALLGYALLAFIALQRTASISAVTEPVWTPLILGAAMIGLETAAGVAAGSLSPSRIVAPVVGIIWYGLLVALAGNAGSRMSSLFPAIDEHWDMSFLPNDSRLLTAAGWCLAAGLVLLSLPALLRRHAVRPRPYTLIPAVLAAAVAAGVLLDHRAPKVELAWAVEAPQPDRPTCTTSGRTTACLWPQERHLMPQLRDAVKSVDSRLGPVPGLNRTFYERGLVPRGRGHTAELTVMSPGITRDALTDDMLAASLPAAPSQCEPHLLKAIGDYPDTYFFEAVVRGRAGAPSEYMGEKFGAAVEEFRAASRPEQDRWIASAADSIRDCRAVPPLPK